MRSRSSKRRCTVRAEIPEVTFLKSHFRYSLGIGHYVFAIVFLLRLTVLARLTISPFLFPTHGDMHFYDEWAQQILQGRLTDHLAFYGLPLYAYVLALVYKLVGYGPFIPGLFQAGFDAGTATDLKSTRLNYSHGYISYSVLCLKKI